MHDAAMTAAPPVWLINGAAHALRIRCDKRSTPVFAELLRKHDEHVLTSLSLPEQRALQRDRPSHLTREARHELTVLLQRAHRFSSTAHAVGRTNAHTHHIDALLRNLGIEATVLERYALPRCREPAVLGRIGTDAYGRILWLSPRAIGPFRQLLAAARADGIQLQPVSGYRSADYQARLIRRKLDRGLPLNDILSVSALPGYSEHHLGTTVDLHNGDGPPLEESFEATPAYAWLCANAGRYGFRLSYPRDNSWGIAYEPWHWRYHDPAISI